MNQNNKLTLSRTNTVVRIPEDIVGPQVSLFANVVSTTPVATVDLWTFLLTTSYQNIVDEYRGTKDPDIRAKIKKFEIPCVTVAGVFDTRAKKRLQHLHSGYICIDIDGKQNPRVKGRWNLVKNMLKERISSLCYAGLSVGGDGLCCIFRIAYPERHKAHFYALVDEIQERTPLIVDESGSDVVRLRVASYDPHPYFNPDAPPYLYYKPNKYSAPRRVKKARKAVMDVATKQRAYSLIKIIQKKQIDITVGRAVWKSIGQALASEFGPEEGLRLFHLVSKWHPDYDPTECDEMFDWCIKNHDDVDIATFFYHCQRYNITFK